MKLQSIAKIVLTLFVINISVLAQSHTVKKEFSKIVPYVSTIEDVTKVYRQGHDTVKRREDFLSISYTIDAFTEVSIRYFRDCNLEDLPEAGRPWIVEEVFFTFDEGRKLAPSDIFLNRDDFVACRYGDVEGQEIFLNKFKNIEFTYLRTVKSVNDLTIRATAEDKSRFKCKAPGVIFTLDRNGFRCNATN